MRGPTAVATAQPGHGRFLQSRPRQPAHRRGDRRKVRSQPIGRVLADICRDLGLYPAHPLWSELRLAINEFGGSWLRLDMDRLNQAAPIAHIVARLKAERAAERAAEPANKPAPPLAGWAAKR